MPTVPDISCTVCQVTQNAAIASFVSVFENLAAFSDLGDEVFLPFSGFFTRIDDNIIQLREDFGSLACGACVIEPAGGASNSLILSIRPSKLYLELVAAITRNGDVKIIDLCHDWPILSVGCGNPTVADGAGESISRVGGAA